MQKEISNNFNITFFWQKVLFISGLTFLLISQLLLTQGNDFVYNQRPIDFAHWLLMLGVVLMIPRTIAFPKTLSGAVGITLTFTGIVCTIGMCVLDFVWWSFPNNQMRNEFTNHISQIPSIWKPFITIGSSSKVFNLGLLILSLTYFKNAKIGVFTILLANLILWHVIPLPHRLVFGYLFTLIGFILIFRSQEMNKI